MLHRFEFSSTRRFRILPPPSPSLSAFPFPETYYRNFLAHSYPQVKSETVVHFNLFSQRLHSREAVSEDQKRA